MTALLDASAIIAYIGRERGWESVDPVLDFAAISTVNVAEAATRFIRAGSSVEDAHRLIEDLHLLVLPVTTEIGSLSSQFASREWGISLGDRICLATALHHNLPVYTADRRWAELPLPVAVKLLR